MKHPRSLGELWATTWKRHAYLGIYPFDFAPFRVVEKVVRELASYDPEPWAAAFSAAAVPFEEKAEACSAAGDASGAREARLQAYGLLRLARFPTTNAPGKRAAYPRSQAMFLAAGRTFEPPIERVQIPFRGRPGEGDRIVGYLRVPTSADGAARLPEPLPLVIHFCGVDSFKEDREKHVGGFLAAGLPLLLIDMPGTGDAPVVGSLDAERMFDAVFDWVGAQPRFDAGRVCLYGGSFGAYWSTKVAHTHRDRVACVVSQGGCAHLAFDRAWLESAQGGEYAFEFNETHAHAFRMGVDEWKDFAPTLSLLRSGLLDEPCAPLLLVNGVRDSVYPIEDMHLLERHGSAKTARYFDAGHMGVTRETPGAIVDWVKARLGV